jgi:hypothetical protein
MHTSDVFLKGKGKAAAPPPSELAATRGQKRTAPAAEQPENYSDDGEPTPHKGETHVSAPKFQVVVQSPPATRAKQRLRTNEAGDAIDIPDSPSEKMWVGRGKVSLQCTFAYSDQLTSD